MMRSYPHAAGYKDPGISRENAQRIDANETPAHMRNLVHGLYEAGFIGTADEAAGALSENILRIRPRCTELVKLNVLERTTQRRRGAGGGTAAVLRLRTIF